MKIKLLSKEAVVPTWADKGSAGLDLYVPKDTVINPGRNLIPIDIAIELDSKPIMFEAQIRPRSGFSLKGMEGYPTGGANTPRRYDADVLLGTIDASYRGNVGVIIKSYEKTPFIIKKGTRVAQMVIAPCFNGRIERVDDLSETERGEGGFGHTGTN